MQAGRRYMSTGHLWLFLPGVWKDIYGTQDVIDISNTPINAHRVIWTPTYPTSYYIYLTVQSHSLHLTSPTRVQATYLTLFYYVKTSMIVKFPKKKTVKYSLHARCLLKNVLGIKTCAKEKKQANWAEGANKLPWRSIGSLSPFFRELWN